MPSETTLRICDPFGDFLAETAAFLEIGDNPGLHYVLSCGQIGAMTACLPPEFNPILVKDGRIHIMRSVNGGLAQREGGSCFLIRKWEYAQDYTTITAVHANDLMRRRFVLYNRSFSNDGIMSLQPADNGVKNIWRRNNGDLINTTYRAYATNVSASDQTQANISAYVSYAPDVSLAPEVVKYMFWRNVMDCILEVCESSFDQGTWLAAEIVAPDENSLTFQTYVGQRGVDRRASTGSGLLFSFEFGNIENALMTVDALEEITFAMSLGAAPIPNQRHTGKAHDTARSGESPFGRIETIVDCNDAPNDGTLTNEAQSAVRAGVPIITAVADLVETDQCIRGIHYNYGDYVTVAVRGVQYDMRLNNLDVTLTASGERTIARFEYTGS